MSESVADEVTKLEGLRDREALTSAEFESAKARVIASAAKGPNSAVKARPGQAGTRGSASLLHNDLSPEPYSGGHETDSLTRQRQSIHFIHLLRGIAALMVMWSHLSGYWLYAYNKTWKLQTLWDKVIVIPLHIYQNGGDLAVIVFFLVSGYIITHVSLKETSTEFGVKRIFRIFPPLAGALAIAFVCETIAIHLHAIGEMPRAPTVGVLPGVGANTGFIIYLRSFFLINWFPAGSGYALIQTWTLLIEVMFYVITIALISYSRRSPLGSTWSMFCIWLLANMILLASPSGHQGENYVIYLAFLILGRVLYLCHDRKLGVAQATTLISALALCFVLFHTVEFPGLLGASDWQSPAAGYLIAVIAFIGLMQVKIDRLPRPFVFFGDISYSLYLLHIPVGMLIIGVLYNAGMPFTVCFCAGAAGSIGAAYISYRFVEVPFQRMARRLLAKRGPGVEVT